MRIFVKGILVFLKKNATVFLCNNQPFCAYIYISMQDLEGDGIDGTIDLFDSYSIYTSADQIGGCSLVNYDEESKKATFLITIQHMGGKPIQGSAMTFSVSQFLSGKNNTEMRLSQINMNSIPNIKETQSEETLSIRGRSYSDESYNTSSRKYLCVDNSKFFEPVSGVTITNYGIIDDKLHVQAHYKDILHFDNHGFIYLTGEDGNTIDTIDNIAFWDEEGKGSYEEYIFDVSPDELDRYVVYAYFCTCHDLIQGNWKVRFTINNQ